MKKTIYLIPVALLCACAGTEQPPTPPLEEMYKTAYEHMDDNNYESAAQTFIDIESTYPASEWAAISLEMATYAQYEADNFAGALSTIDRFMRFHPGHADAAYMLYIKGMCFYRQVSDVRREPGMSSYALNAFNQLVQRFPESEYAKNAKNKIIILKNYIAGKTMYSARRDLKRQNYTTAITNLQKIVLTAQDTQMTAEAMFRLSEAYTAIGLSEQANGYREMLTLNFPDSEWAKKLKD